MKSDASTQRLTVVFVLEHYYPHVGGVETLFAQLAEALARIGHRAVVVTSRFPGTASTEIYNGVEIHRSWCPPIVRRYAFMITSLPKLFRVASRANVVHTTTYNAAIPAWFAARCLRKPVVITVHEIFAEQWHRLRGLNSLAAFGFRLFEWLVFRLGFDHCFCVSRFTEARLRSRMGVSPGRTSVTYPPVDHRFWTAERHERYPVRNELGLQPDAFVYLAFGRPGVSKGLEYLIDAATTISRELPRSRLILLLSRNPIGRYRALRRQVRDRGLESHVTFVDSVSTEVLPGFLLGTDLVVVPSVSEGFGYAAVEAALLHCPLLATSGHATEEVIPGSAIFVPPENSDEIARAVVEFAGTGRAPSSPIRHFTIADHVKKVMAVYERLAFGR